MKLHEDDDKAMAQITTAMDQITAKISEDTGGKITVGPWMTLEEFAKMIESFARESGE